MEQSGAPNDGFLSDPLKRYFRLSRVPSKLCMFILGCAIILFICSVILGELDSFRNYQDIFVHFPKTLGLISFPKILADLFFGTRSDIFINPKSLVLKFPISRKFGVKIPLENRRGLRAFRTNNLPKRSVGCP